MTDSNGGVEICLELPNCSFIGWRILSSEMSVLKMSPLNRYQCCKCSLELSWNLALSNSQCVLYFKVLLSGPPINFHQGRASHTARYYLFLPLIYVFLLLTSHSVSFNFTSVECISLAPTFSLFCQQINSLFFNFFNDQLVPNFYFSSLTDLSGASC